MCVCMCVCVCVLLLESHSVLAYSADVMTLESITTTNSKNLTICE